MSKAKSIVITTILAIAVAVATFFAAISFPYANDTKQLNSVAGNIHLGADFTGYSYTTVYPKGIITYKEYVNKCAIYEERKNDPDLDESIELVDPSTVYFAVDANDSKGFYADREKFTEKFAEEGGTVTDAQIVEEIKKSVASDADKLNSRFGARGSSSYSVGVVNGVAIKISIPTDFTYAAYKGKDESSRSASLSTAQSTLSTIMSFGNFTMRTTNKTIEISETNEKYNLEKKGSDEWTDKIKINGQPTYSYAGTKDAATFLSSVTTSQLGSSSVISFNFTSEGAEEFAKITKRAAAASDHSIYFYVGETQLINYNCETEFDGSTLSLQSSDFDSARNAAITLNSAVNGGDLHLNYRGATNEKGIQREDFLVSTADHSSLAAVMTLVACVLVMAGVTALLVVKYKKLGAVTAFIAFAFAIILLYALAITGIQVTFAVIFTCMLCIATFVASCAIVYEEVRKLTSVGRTVQASVKDAYKNVLATVTDMHVLLVLVAILLAAIGVGELAACGLIGVIGFAASYVLYWFMRFMWFVTGSLDKDKFKFAGLKRVVYEDD